MAKTDELILVLGATSLIGGYLLPRLGGREIAVSRAPPPGATGRWIAADLEADPELPPAATVVSLIPLWLLEPLIPRLLAGGMTRLVAFSSTSRFTKQDSRERDERLVAERLAMAETAVMMSPAAWTILRPTLIYAEGRDGNVSRLAAMVRRFGVLPLAGEGKGLRQPVHAEDLAIGTVLVLKSDKTRHRSYDLPGGETLRYRTMCERVFEGLGRRPRILTVPPWLWRFAFNLLNPKGANASMGERMAEDLVFDSRPARADFGWAPRAFHPKF